MAGRPSKLTPTTKKELLAYISLGMSYADSCALVDIHYSTMLKWLTRGEKAKTGEYFQFFIDIKKAKAKGKAAKVNAIRKQGLDGSWQALAWLLERQNPDEYGKQVHSVKHSGEVTSVNMTAEQWKKERESRLKEAEETMSDYEQGGTE